MRDVSAIDLAPGLRLRTVVGSVGSFSVAQFDPGAASALHHHAHEQADISIAGELDMTLDDRVEKLGPGFGVVVPANVPHAIANKGRERMTLIEFHVARRLDLVPPRRPGSLSAGDTLARLPAGPQLVHPLDRPIRESPFSAFHVPGETCVLAWRRLNSGTGAVEIRADSVERFEYVVRGELQLTSAEGASQIRARSLSYRRALSSRFRRPGRSRPQ